MKSKITWFLFAALAIVISLYPLGYAFMGETGGLLSSKSPELLAHGLWKLGFYLHISGGGLALLVGWTQFSARWRTQRPQQHRNIGKVYLLSVFLAGLAAIGISPAATGGWIPQLGFGMLGVIWVGTATMALVAIRQGKVSQHQFWMFLSYAACFGAVTLRIWLPLLIMWFEGNFLPAYRIVAWLSWVPNLLVGYWLWKRQSRQPIQPILPT